MATPNCQATTKAGDPCKIPPLPGSDYCRMHQPEDPAEAETCGHQNKHWTGEPDLFCDLAEGHEGPHSGIYREVKYEHDALVSDQQARTYWTDAAGIAIE